MRYISLFSGIEAATVGWHDMGWNPVVFADFDDFPSAVLKHHYPHVPNAGDVLKHDWTQYRGKADLIVGGSPCQSFSHAGKRLGMDDPRGNLALHYLRIIRDVQPKWFIYENVPGLLSSNEGHDFATFLGEMVKLRYGFAYRVLDAQYFGVPQRRRRVFVVGCADGDWRSAAAVLFDKESLCGNLASSKTKRQSSPLFSQGSIGSEGGELGRGIVHCEDKAPTMCAANAPGRTGQAGEEENAIIVQQEIGFSHTQGLDCQPSTRHFPTLRAEGGGMAVSIPSEHIVRRLTPIECERLQGFPDNYTQIPWKGRPAEECPATHRYKALGNSMAVPVMRWIGMRIDMLDAADLSKREKSKTTKQMTLW